MKLLIASVGIMSTQIIDSLPTNGLPLSEITKIFIQIVIAFVSIFHIIKKPKEVKHVETQNN